MRPSRVTWLILCAVLCPLASCREESAPRQGVEIERPGPGQWTPRVYAGLAEEVARDCSGRSIPRLGSKAFDHAIAHENIAVHDLSALPTAERLAHMADLTVPASELMKAYHRCGELSEMVLIGMFLLEAWSRAAPELDAPNRDDFLGGMTDMLMGFFTILKSRPDDMAALEPYAPRFGAIAGAVGRHLPPDWMRVQLASLRTAAASMENQAHRRVIETIVTAASPVE